MPVVAGGASLGFVGGFLTSVSTLGGCSGAFDMVPVVVVVVVVACSFRSKGDVSVLGWALDACEDIILDWI